MEIVLEQCYHKWWVMTHKGVMSRFPGGHNLSAFSNIFFLESSWCVRGAHIIRIINADNLHLEKSPEIRYIFKGL